MTAFIALLRAVNVGGTGKLPMSELKALCDAAGFAKASTYIASGNALFESDLAEAEVKAKLEAALQTYAGKPVGVLVRTAAEMAAVAEANPFAERPGNLVAAVFLDLRRRRTPWTPPSMSRSKRWRSACGKSTSTIRTVRANRS